MSSIAGIVLGAGGPASEGAVRGMLGAMARRAPDGAGVRSAGRAALGHGALRTLPEEESQPIEEDGLVITADARLDNRDELIAQLGLGERAMSDARLILKAYRRWGGDCAERLLGDFAFALWDRQEQALFAARDFIGVKPFYYHHEAGRLVFASDSRGMLADTAVPRRVDETRIAEFLAGLPPRADRTLYADVLRLPPAHTLTFKTGGLALRRYWRPPEGPEAPRHDAPEAFAELLRTAVKARLRSTALPGAMLSGGLDSTSLACLAAPLAQEMFGKPLPTFSVVFDETPQWDERPFIEAALDLGGFDPHFVDGHGLSSIERLGELLEAQDGPFLAPNLDLTSTVYGDCARQGVRVVLSGHGGDEVVSQGFGRLQELAAAGRFGKLWRESRAIADTYGEPAAPIFLRHIERQGPAKPAAALAQRVLRKLGAKRPSSAPHWATILNRDLAERTAVRASRREALSALAAASNHRDHYLAGIDPRQQSYALDVLDRAAACAGVEARHPFWDRRLLEFCLSLPSEEILDGGWPRRILRRGMEGVLPPKVQWRRDKLDFTPHMVIDMLDRRGDLLDAVIIADTHDIGGFVDLVGARAALDRVRQQREEANGQDVQFVWRTIAFAFWLKSERALPQGLRLA